MSNSVTDARVEVAQVLEDAGIKSFDTIPNKFNGNIAVLAPGEPYITFGTTLGELTVNMTVVLTTKYSARNQTAMAQLDDMIVKSISAYTAEGYFVGNDVVVRMYPVGETEYLGAEFTIKSHYKESID